MKAEDWQKAKSIFNAALDRPEEERSRFVSEACDGDEKLKRGVEKLLSSFETDFLEKAVIHQGGGGGTRRWQPAKSVDHYTIVESLGEGGMGEVYLARDEKLGRRVAIKVLNEKFGADEAGIGRFVQEAKAASALNHPNILVIHEVGEINGLNYIVSEFVDGKTLREVIAERALSFIEVLDISIQIASALAAAHSARIVHRDIKPENVIVRADGYVKVLDFGLAKLLPEPVSLVPADDTVKNSLTDSGLILGTVSYMSPEQAKGEKVDERTDIFSLGIVISEMVTGRTPFAADSTPEALANLITKEPPPLSRFSDGVPNDLQRIVSKTLRKERDARYQTMKGLLADLKEVRETLSFEAKLGRTQTERMERRFPTEVRAYERITADPQSRPSGPLAATADITDAYPAAGHETGSRLRVAGALALMVAALLGIGYGVYTLAFQEKAKPAAFKNFTVSRATAEGNVWNATISKDGKYLAYSTSDGGAYSLWTKHVASNSRVQIVSRNDVVSIFASAFSPDGGYVIYSVQEANRTDFDVYQVPVLGGVGRKLLSGVLPVVSVSPDGRQLAFIRRDPQTQDSKVSIADLDGNNERVVAEKKFPEMLGAAAGPTWSPDGTTLAMANTDAEEKLTAVGVGVRDGNITTLIRKEFNWIGVIRWLPTGTGLVMVAQEKPAGSNKIWQADLASGEIRPITGDLDNYLEGSLTPTGDGLSMIAVNSPFSPSIFVSDRPDFSATRPVSTRTGINNGAWGISWDRGGRLFSVSQDGDKSETWLIGPNSEAPKVVTGGSTVDGLTVSPDGRYLVSISDRTGEWLIWRTDINGDNAKQLVPAGTKVVLGPSITNDSASVIYSVADGGIWKVSIDGGEQVRLASTPLPNTFPQISPNGSYLACQDTDEQSRPRISVFRIQGGEWKPFRTLALPPKTLLYNPFRWSTNSRSLIYIDTTGNVSNLWQMSLDGGKPKQITNFNSHAILNFAFSLDGNRLALARNVWTADAVLLTQAGTD